MRMTRNRVVVQGLWETRKRVVVHRVSGLWERMPGSDGSISLVLALSTKTTLGTIEMMEIASMSINGGGHPEQCIIRVQLTDIQLGGIWPDGVGTVLYISDVESPEHAQDRGRW